MIGRRCYAFAVAFGLVFTILVCAQDKPAGLKFEVASIKLWKPGTSAGGITALPGGQEYRTVGAPVRLMISLMYKIPDKQIEGGPDWMNTDRWDIDAKADRAGYNIDDLHAMFQNMLADEFKLKFHKETKEGPVYVLTIDKAGLKMKVNQTPEAFKVPINGGPDGAMIGTRVPMQYLCWWLGSVLQRGGEDRPVINMSGLDGNYDFTLSFAPELPPDFPKDRLPPGFLDRPNIFQALREQLGLKLQPQKGPVEYYVIDHLEKPAAN